MRYIVSGESMEPTFHAGDRLFVCRFWYRLRPLRVGDVVVLTDPRDDKLLLKRITAVEEGHIFVVGDNKAMSTDSRTFGAVSSARIVGKVIWRYYRKKGYCDNEH